MVTGVITPMIASSGWNILLTKLDKFDGTNTDLQSWLRNFERCCTIVGNSVEDELVKGQLLFLCLTGQAFAVVEQLEEEKKPNRSFQIWKKGLKVSFNQCTKMAEFDQRIQLVTESEDEFILSLVKRCRTAIPTVSTEDINRAIKRKFLSGVSPDLRCSIFCTDPYATSVTYDALLEATRKAKLHIVNLSNDSLQPSASATTPVIAEPTLEAVNELANAGINLIHDHSPGHDLKGAKTLPLGQSLSTKTLPLGQNRESKAPPTGHKVRKFHKDIYKL